MEAVDRALELSGHWDIELGREMPPGARVFDAHTHIGNDIDGMYGHPQELLETMNRYGITHAFTFCMDEPDRHPAFRAANDRTLAWTAEMDGRLIPFVRLDLAESPMEEAERCLDLGARGIKLHPRAQGFLLTDERLEPVFALAAERGVPILIHGGRGLPPISGALGRLVDRHPGVELIIAHAGIADMAGLAHVFGARSGVFFDTSAWSPVDLLDFYRQVSPEQVVYASDYPYGQQPSSLLIAIRTARRAGFNEDQVRNMLSGNAERIAAGEQPLEPTRPRGSDVFSQPMVFARIHGYLSMATPLLWMRQPDTYGVLGLALNACDEKNGAAERVELEQIRELLACAQDLWKSLPEIENDVDRVAATRLTFKLLHMADIVAVTPGVHQ
jgi:predicted TIM-barrel fold metal-dependent hydrolase